MQTVLYVALVFALAGAAITLYKRAQGTLDSRDAFTRLAIIALLVVMYLVLR